MKKMMALLLATIMLLSTTALAAENAPMGIAVDPNAVVDRGTAVQTLYEREGAPMVVQSIVFDDAAGKWYANAVVWACGEGIISGDSNGRFDGERAVTRIELAAMLYRYAQSKGMGFTGLWSFRLDFADTASIPAWANEAVSWCVMNGILSGKDGKLLPRGTVTRAEFADMLAGFDALTAGEALSLWTEDSAARNTLIDYIDAITDEDSEDYIPVEDRIAVFDFDGTLFCETDPNYFDHMLLVYRVLEDPDYKDKASDFERKVALEIVEQNTTGASFPDMEIDHGKAVASAFKGMTVDELIDYIQKFKQLPMPSYSGMKLGEGFYLPMVQIVKYLQANDFTVYIVSGTDRFIIRGIMYDNVLDIPTPQLIGSDETLVSNNQGDADALSYMFADGDKMVLGGEFIVKNLKMNKVTVIMQEIGKQPVLSFGNSTGDSSMAEYVVSGNSYRSLAFMLCCDDTERENGNQAKADKMYALCEEFGWVPISMKNDWKTIYGDGVTYLKDGKLAA